MAALTLAELLPGESAIIRKIDTEGLLRQRLLDLGLLPGTCIQTRFLGRRGDPAAYLVRGTVLALRRSTAQKVLVQPIGRS
nr:ferrous iron transport protein A [Bacillota bacterium]